MVFIVFLLSVVWVHLLYFPYLLYVQIQQIPPTWWSAYRSLGTLIQEVVVVERTIWCKKHRWNCTVYTHWKLSLGLQNWWFVYNIIMYFLFQRKTWSIAILVLGSGELSDLWSFRVRITSRKNMFIFHEWIFWPCWEEIVAWTTERWRKKINATSLEVQCPKGQTLMQSRFD